MRPAPIDESPEEARKRAEREEGHRLAREKELRQLRIERLSWGRLAETGFWSRKWAWVVIPSPLVVLYILLVTFGS
ncbi:MAG: hypothetical protein RLZZ01_641 [Actinomycetota bacterium]|jgi:hypothetical protein